MEEELRVWDERLTQGEFGKYQPRKPFIERIQVVNGCWVWSGAIQRSGYGGIRINKVTWMIHRLTYTLRYGTIPQALCVLHRCDNPPCCNPEHLFLGDKQDNAIDRETKGRGYRSDHRSLKLNSTTYQEILNRLSVGETNMKIAKDLNIAPGTVSRVRTQKYPAYKIKG